MVWRLSFSQAVYEFVKQVQLKTHDEVRAKLEGEVVIIDLLNQALNFGNGHDAVRRAAGKRIVSMVLAGARPCAVIDGRCGAPGSGKPPRDMEASRPRGDAVAACRWTYHDYTQRVAAAVPLNVHSMERNFN